MDVRLAVAVFLWLSLVWIAIAPLFKKTEFSLSDWKVSLLKFSLALAVALPAWRWRSLTYNGEINVDEGTAIAIALKYLHDPIPWRSVDGITCGPLSTWISLWAPLLGLKLSYVSIRINTIILMFFCGVGTVYSMREIVGARYSFLFTLPPFALLLSTLNFDFLYFAMEYLPMTMTVWGIYLILRQNVEVSSKRSFLVGLITGAMPFTKLQASLVAVFMFFVCLVVTVRNLRSKQEKLIIPLLWLCLGGALVPVSILLPVKLAGAWSEFLNFYLLCGTTYKSQSAQPGPLVFLLKADYGFGIYFSFTLLIALAGAVFIRPSRSKGALRDWGGGLLMFITLLSITLYSVFRSGFGFPHYLLLLIFPLCFLMAWGLKDIQRSNISDFRESGRVKFVTGSIIFMILTQNIFTISQYLHEPRLLSNWGQEINPVVPVLLKFAGPGDSMAVWGWNNKLHAFTGIRPATRFIGTSYVTDPSPNYNRHRELFLSDVKADKPRLFVDAIDEFRWPTWPPGAQAQHEMIPELAEWVRSEYRLVAAGSTAPNRLPIRVYVRKE